MFLTTRRRRRRCSDPPTADLRDTASFCFPETGGAKPQFPHRLLAGSATLPTFPRVGGRDLCRLSVYGGAYYLRAHVDRTKTQHLTLPGCVDLRRPTHHDRTQAPHHTSAMTFGQFFKPAPTSDHLETSRAGRAKRSELTHRAILRPQTPSARLPWLYDQKIWIAANSAEMGSGPVSARLCLLTLTPLGRWFARYSGKPQAPARTFTGGAAWGQAGSSFGRPRAPPLPGENSLPALNRPRGDGTHCWAEQGRGWDQVVGATNVYCRLDGTDDSSQALRRMPQLQRILLAGQFFAEPAVAPSRRQQCYRYSVPTLWRSSLAPDP